MISKPKILIIENSIAITGALKSIVRTSQDLKSFFEFSFVIPQKSKGRGWIEKSGFFIINELPLRELSKRLKSIVVYLPYLFINASRLNRIVKQQRIAIIHVNDVYNLLPLVIRLLGNKTPYICHIRFMPDRFPSLLLRFWLKLHIRFAAKIIAVSQSVINQLPSHPKLIYIHNELPLEERHTQVMKRSEKPIFLYLSNFIEGKGQNYALESFAKISNLFPDWRLRFVGGDMGLRKNKIFQDILISKAKTLGIFDKIEWKGFTEDVEWEYKQADIVLNFSESESFSITCLEALYFGRPLIATDCGGPSELIKSMETGILVPNRNVDEMVNAMILLIQDIELRKKIGLSARKYVKGKFSLENTSMKLKDVYKAALKN